MPRVFTCFLSLVLGTHNWRMPRGTNRLQYVGLLQRGSSFSRILSPQVLVASAALHSLETFYLFIYLILSGLSSWSLEGSLIYSKVLSHSQKQKLFYINLGREFIP